MGLGPPDTLVLASELLEKVTPEKVTLQRVQSGKANITRTQRHTPYINLG